MKVGLFQPNGQYFDYGIYDESYMKVGSLIAPKKEIQNRFFDKMTQLLKNVETDKHKATIMHYLVNYLHLFYDGNGRTARAIYNILNDSHSTEMQIEKRTDFYKIKKIPWMKTAGTCASLILMKYLLETGLIKSKYEDLSKYNYITTNTMKSPVHITDKSKKHLSHKMVFNIHRALIDNNESLSSSALALLVMLTKKGTLRPIKDYFFGKEKQELNGYICNSICIGSSDNKIDGFNGYSPKEMSEIVMENWEPEDYLCVVDVVDKLKECILDLFIDFAERPSSFKFSEDLNMIDALTQGKKLCIKTDEDYENMFKNIHNSPFKIDHQSRTYKNMQALKNILEIHRDIPKTTSLADLIGPISSYLPPNSPLLKFGNKPVDNEQKNWER